MLEIKHLTKIYSAKGGAETKALDDVSVSFGETGLVFLLGKSGSGKSTLLNLAGGLDSPTSGEVIVMGKSSKDFSGADFDSYRNTFIGFIFQEYNVLDEFTVEDNIALALELQGKSKDKEKIASILRDVELENFAKRKPNTLSGGQKQRIAIARALIKDPQIIMADEPTGALDSATGKQVFDTLKSLSKTRLVLVVSHDREFAEVYGDRIIELKDGKIISDVTKEHVAAEKVTENVKRLGPDTLTVEGGKIDDKTLKEIEAFLKESKGEVLISKGESDIASFRRVNRIGDDGARERFGETKSVDLKEYDGRQTKFIKSHMPLGKAVKMGASGLKTKPFRLIFTILLAVVAFVMFGVLSTFMLYDPNYSVSQALQEADYPSLTVRKSYSYFYESWYTDENGEEHLEYASDSPSTQTTLFGVQELKDKNTLGHGNFAGIFTLASSWSSDAGSLSLVTKNGNTTVNLPIMVTGDLSNYYPIYRLSGYTDCGAAYMQSNGFSMVGDGHYPKDKTEIALPRYIAELIVNTKDSGIEKVEDVVGRKIKISTYANTIPDKTEFTVSAVYNVGEIPQKYESLKNTTENISPDSLRELTASYNDFLSMSYHTILYVTEDFYDAYKYVEIDEKDRVYPQYYDGIYVESWEMTDPAQSGRDFYTDTIVAAHPDTFKFFDLDGNEKAFSVSDGQVWISESEWSNKNANAYGRLANDLQNLSSLDPEAYEYFHSEEWQDLFNSMYSDPESFSDVKATIDTWYPDLNKKQLTFQFANEMRNMIEYFGESETYTEFLNAIERINNVPNPDSKFGKATAADWTTIENTLNALKTDQKYLPFVYRSYFYRLQNSSDDMYQKLEDAAIKAGYEGTWILTNLDPNMPEEFEAKYALIKQLVDENYEAVFGCKPGEETFTAEPDEIQWDYYYMDYFGNGGKLEVVGYYSMETDNYGWTYLLSASFLDSHAKAQEGNKIQYFNKEKTDYVAPEDAKYNFIITLTDNTQEEIAAALSATDASVVYGLTNRVYSELTMFLSMITSMQTVFLIVGLVVGVFAALMLLNFISVSITAKKKEIGILRAVGARGSDAFKIFFSESLIIALICFVIASVGSFFVCGLLNNTLADIVSMQLLNFNIVNILLILVISLGISFIATFFPVWFAAKKKPVESIRAL